MQENPQIAENVKRNAKSETENPKLTEAQFQEATTETSKDGAP